MREKEINNLVVNESVNVTKVSTETERKRVGRIGH